MCAYTYSVWYKLHSLSNFKLKTLGPRLPPGSTGVYLYVLRRLEDAVSLSTSQSLTGSAAIVLAIKSQESSCLYLPHSASVTSMYCYACNFTCCELKFRVSCLCSKLIHPIVFYLLKTKHIILLPLWTMCDKLCVLTIKKENPLWQFSESKWGWSMPNPNKEAMLRSRENVYLINGTVTERLPKPEPCTKATVETSLWGCLASNCLSTFGLMLPGVDPQSQEQSNKLRNLSY